MQQEKALLPFLRFIEFTNFWESHLIGDFYKDLRTGMTPYRGNKSFYLNGTIPWITSGELNYNEIIETNEYITEEAVKQTNLLVYPKGTLFIAITGLEAPGTRGRCAFNGVPAATNQSCMAFLETESVDIKFLYYWYNKNSEKLYFKFAQGTKQQSFNNKIVEKFTIVLPLKLEQQKIASFLSAVDKKIQQLERKKELLDQYKKGIMQQLFSQNLRFIKDDGSNYPNWEERKLKEIILDFIVPMRDKPKQLDGQIPWCRIEDFESKYLFTSKSNQGVSYETVKNMNLKIFPFNTLLVSCSAKLGKCAIVKKELITNQTFIGLVPNIDFSDVEFLFYLMGFKERDLNRLSSGTTISYLSREEFENFKVSIPNLEEQSKIAKFLSAIDKKIELVSTQITQTQTFKKGLLQQMFV